MPVFENAGIEVEILRTEYAGHARDLAGSVELYDAFCAIGGDGTGLKRLSLDIYLVNG